MIFAVFSLINVLYDRRHGAISLRQSNLLADLDHSSIPHQEAMPPTDSSSISASWQKVSPAQSSNLRRFHVILGQCRRFRLLPSNLFSLSITVLHFDCLQEEFAGQI